MCYTFCTTFPLPIVHCTKRKKAHIREKKLRLRGVVLGEVLVVVRVEHRLAGVALRERLRAALAVDVVLGPAVHGEVRRLQRHATAVRSRRSTRACETEPPAGTLPYLVDERARARVRARVRRVPERAAEVDVAEVVGVDVRVRARVRARAVVRERRVVVRVDVRVVALHGAVARARVRPEPRRVARRGRRVALQVRERGRGVALRGRRRGVQRGLLGGRAAVERRALREPGAGHRELAAAEGRDVRLGVRADLGDLVVGVDDVEEVRSLDRVLAVAGAGEVVRRRDCGRTLTTIP